MPKRILCCCLAALAALWASGCWSRMEVNELAIVSGIGVDRTGEGKLLVTLVIAKPEEIAGRNKKPGGNPAQVKGEEGITIEDSLRKAALQVPRFICLSHSRVIVIGERLAREGVGEITDFFSREREIRLSSFLFIARGEARAILTRSNRLEELIPTALFDLARGRAGFTIKLKDFLALRSSESSDPAAGLLAIIPDRAPGEAGEVVGPGLVGTALFKDDRMVAILDHMDTRGLLWLRQEMRRGIVSVTSPVEEGKLISVNIIRAGRKLVPSVRGDDVSMTVIIDAEGDLAEQQALKDLTRPETVKAIERRVAEDIRKRVEGALRVAQKEAGADPFEFGEAVRRAFPREWQRIAPQWDQIYPQMPVTLDVRFKLRHTGLTTKPVGATEKELKGK